MPDPRSRFPLELRLPLLIGALLLLVIVGIGAGVYAEGRRASLTVTNARLTSVAQQLSAMFTESARLLRAQSAAAAGRLPAAFGRSASVTSAASALQFEGPNADQVVASQLRDSTGKVIASLGRWASLLDTASVADAQPARAGRDSVAIGGFRLAGDSLVYPIVARVPGAARNLLVHWRRLGTSRRAREQISQLIGSDAALYLGSSVTGTWTDLEGQTPAPALDKSRFLAAERQVAGTPWQLVLHFPLAPVRAGTNAFMARIAALAAIALLLGLFGTWYISRNVLRTLEARVRMRTAELNHVLEELRDAQESLVRKEKLAMLGQLASGVGHELRNPLGVMTNAVYYLRMVLREQPPQVAEYLDILQQQVTLSEKIVSDLLDFARQKPPQRKPVSVAELTQAQVARFAPPGTVRIESDIATPLPRVMVDEVQIGQIVLNLLTNAMQAMDGKGRIVIRARADNGHVSYEVADSGPGIAPEHMHKIFEPLFTTKARGIGLGLAVSRTLARANEGDLTVTSTPGQGATFRLTMPAEKAA